MYSVHYSKKPNGHLHWRIDGKINGKRSRAWFKTEKEAKTESKKRNSELVEYGSKSIFTVAQRQDAEESLRILEPYGLRLTDAAHAIVERLQKALKSETVKDAIARMINEQRARYQRDNISKRHFETFTVIANRLSKEFGEYSLSELTAEKIEKWLLSLPLAVGTRNQFRRYIGLVLPGLKLQKERSRKMKAVHIVTPEQADLLIHHTPKEVIPFFSIGLFAGLRVSEIERLDWKHINVPGRTIDLTWFPTKTLQPRWAPICDKLAGILEPLAHAEGRVCPPNLRRLRETAVRKAGFPWKQNTCRSSFISYRLALIQDVSKVALEAGHDPQTLAAWYRKPIQRVAAERYFH
jgi:integrase